MRLSRFAFIFAAVYVALIGGTYYASVFPIRMVHHAFVTLVLIAWLIDKLRKGQGIPTTPLNPLLFALIGVWTITSLLSLDPRMALESVWLPLTHLVMFLIIADLIGRGREILVIETTFLLAALVALLALAQLTAWYTGLDLIPEPGVGWLGVGMIIPPETPMIYVPLGVSTWLAAFAACAAVFAFGWSLSSRRRDLQVALLVLSGMLLLVLIGAFSRGGFVALAAGVFVLVALRALKNLLDGQGRARQLIVRLLPAVVVVGVVAGVIFLIGQRESRWTGDVLRLGLWGGAVDMIAGDPLTGVGPGLFGRAYRLVRDPSYVDDRLGTAHNAYLNNAAENGVLGVIVMLGFAVVIIARWWRLWRRAETPSRQRRLEAALAALTALGVQSLFDSFVITPIVLLSLVLIAYCTVEPGALLTLPSSSLRRWSGAALVVILAAYGAAFIQIDRAHALFNQSVRERDLAAAEAAHALDPHLNLYALQAAYLTALNGELPTARAAYEQAVALEPTWDTGWINLAAVAEQQGDIDAALAYLERAMAINAGNVGTLNWARIADAHDAAPDALITERYVAAMSQQSPLSDFWTQTERRREALAQFVRLETLPLEWRYRVAALREPAYAETLVSENPTSAAAWWVVGEHALTVEADPVRAADAFTQAIHLDRGVGDYYVARARAETAFDPAAAQRDLNIAAMLYTFQEYPNAVRVELTDDPERVRQLRVAAVPPRVIDQNFEGVLFAGRVASFEIVPSMRRPGIGAAGLAPWYDLAADYLAVGDVESARSVYRAILDAAPGEGRAADELARLTDS